MMNRKKMLQLPKIERDPEVIQKLCLCRPICKSRRREWKGLVQNTSAELLLERKPKKECIRRWPTRVYPNSPCPLFGKTPYVNAVERGKEIKQEVVRICQAPIDEVVDVTYLRMYQTAKKIGALDLVKGMKCAFCDCCSCCPCSFEYEPTDPERQLCRRHEMRAFDKRVKEDCVPMKIMYM